MNFLKEFSQNNSKVIIFGASILGKIVLDTLEIMNIEPVGFCDNDTGKQKDNFHGYKVISFQELCSDHPDALIIIGAGRYFTEIKEQLSKAGFNQIFSDSDIISCLDFENTPREKLDGIIWHLAKIGKLSEVAAVPEDSLHIPRLNVVVTTRCTLKCEHCSSLMPHYQNPGDLDRDTIISSLDKLFQSTDLIYHVEVLGGETFLNKEVSVITKHLIDSQKVLHIDIVTNGTIVPSDSELKALKHKSVSIVIDDYGDASGKIKPLIKALKEHQIDYRMNKHWAWADLGGFESRQLSEKGLSHLFKACNFNSCAELLNGKIHRCPRSSHGNNLNLIPDYRSDYIDLLNFPEDSAALKEKLRDFFYKKPFINACNHCNGNTSDSLTLTPAEQKKRSTLDG